MKKINLSAILLALIPASLCFSLRINVLFILAYLLVVLFQPKLNHRFTRALKMKWLYPFMLLYLLHVLSMLWSDDWVRGWFILEKKASLFFLPLAMAMDAEMSVKNLQQSFRVFTWALLSALVVCIGFAAWQYYLQPTWYHFFYHNLGKPLKFNAIFFSLYCFTGLGWWFYLKDKLPLFNLPDKISSWIAPFTFSIGIVLLSSKLFIFLLFLFLILALLSGRKKQFAKVAGILMIVGVGSLALLKAPRERFKELALSKWEVVGQERFSWDTPLSGLTMRMVFLKFGAELLTEQRSWLGGVGVGDAQEEFNQAMKRYHLYIGNPDLGDTGYLNYDFHNQYMELLVQIGIWGLVAFIIIPFQMVKKALLYHWDFFLVGSAITFFVVGLTESFMETQKGVVFFAYNYSAIYLLYDDNDFSKTGR